jgi:hypothetical protein
VVLNSTFAIFLDGEVKAKPRADLALAPRLPGRISRVLSRWSYSRNQLKRAQSKMAKASDNQNCLKFSLISVQGISFGSLDVYRFLIKNSDDFSMLIALGISANFTCLMRYCYLYIY